ncbi:matrix metalloproteinase [Euphorbia peplus]|nr:matrix metalloproteinase [Euphorbia peplus]
MASKAFSFFTFILLIFTSFVSNPAFANLKPSAFDFVKNLEGCRKGEKVLGIQQLKQYLQRFGYLNYQNESFANDNDFDDYLESAIKTYQINFNLKATGYLDPETVSQMMMPRCGVADIINGQTRMASGKSPKSTSKFHAVSRYAFLPGTPKWPPNKYYLTYGFELDTLPEAVEPVKSAFRSWQGVSQFTFEITEYYNASDITINFVRGEHGDGHPFDGRGGVLAHGLEPQQGKLHYDADDKWANRGGTDAMDIESVALHEIGHILGLAHTSVTDAIMFPTINTGETKTLKDDDIQGIWALYNL